MTQPNLFESAKAGRDKGMASAEQHSGEEWADYADQFIEDYARSHRTVFVDDLWDAGLVEPPSPRALGPRMLAASRRGLIRKTDRVRPSVRSHLTGKPIWISLIYEDS
jgi:hypothetical protein